jgi:hypothetical protein
LSESKKAAWFVWQIGLLYAVEKELREKNAGPQLRAAIRTWQSRPILARLRRAMELVRRRTLPQGLLGQAIDYTLKRWQALTRFVDDGLLEIDNNLENAIRPSALGKKELVVYWPSRGRGTQRGDLHPAGHLSAAWDQSIRLFERFVHAPASGQNHPEQRVHTGGNGGRTHRREGGGESPLAYAQISKNVVDISRDTR